jgi:hypothetical protein
MHKDRRLEYCLKFRGWRDDIEWTRIIFSNECYVQSDSTKGTIWITWRPGDEWDEDCVVAADSQPKVRIMVWGCVMRDCKGPLVVLNYPGGKGGGMTAERYQDQVATVPETQWSLAAALITFNFRFSNLSSVLFTL